MEDGTDVGYPGEECTDTTVDTCEGECATLSMSFKYTMSGGTAVDGFADLKNFGCNRENLCSDMEVTLKSGSMGTVTEWMCNVATCDTELCNYNGAKSEEKEKDESEEKERAYNSSLAVHISAVLLSSVLGYLF